MNVSIKRFDVEMQIKNSGIELDVYNAGGETHLGDLTITKTKLVWCRGRTRRGVEITWEDFIEYMESRGA